MKKWQLDHRKAGRDGYFYYCVLCDEALILSTKLFDPRKISLLFETCPGCGFDLDKVLGYENALVPQGEDMYANPKYNFVDTSKPEHIFPSIIKRGSSLNREFTPCVNTGIERVDQTLVLRPGQLVALEGDYSHDLSLLLCARAPLPEPLGMGGDVMFLDGGNVFDTYRVTDYSIGLGLENGRVEGRIHISRAFTHYQLTRLITEKLPKALDQYHAKLAIVSDITLLYSDPDVRDKQEALELFRKSIRFLASLSQSANILVIATNLKHRNASMESVLTRLAHVHGRFDDMGSCVQLTVRRHPFQRPKRVLLNDHETLLKWLPLGNPIA